MTGEDIDAGRHRGAGEVSIASATCWLTAASEFFEPYRYLIDLSVPVIVGFAAWYVARKQLTLEQARERRE